MVVVVKKIKCSTLDTTELLKEIGLQPCHKKFKSCSFNRRLIFKTGFSFLFSLQPSARNAFSVICCEKF